MPVFSHGRQTQLSSLQRAQQKASSRGHICSDEAERAIAVGTSDEDERAIAVGTSDAVSLT